ncbi:MAG: molecular chaperone DnaK, partial [Clostridia bacterium]|nr:molecular chaperone DnaK [Clostridia bacterium]
DTEAIKAATDELQKKFYDVSAKMYQAANPQGAGPDMNGAGPDMGGAQGGTYDGDYTVVDDDNK